MNENQNETVDPKRLLEFCSAILVAVGVPAADSNRVADTLVQADLWGHQSHGVMRLPWYVRRLKSGAMRATTDARWVVDAGAVGVLDGNDGIGQVLATQAMQSAVRRAKVQGLGAVAVRNSNHFGTAMYYSLMAAAQNCVALVCTNASPAMAPWGGREKRVGTNPWSLAAPAGRHAPMVLDVANTAVARGKVYLARQRGEPIPAGWGLTADGTPTTDAAAAIAGLIAPMASHKGYAIAVMIDVLAGVLSGSSFGADVHGPYEPGKRSGCGHLMLVLDIAAFMPVAAFCERIEALVAELKSTPLAGGTAEIFYPGEMEARSSRELAVRGLALPSQTLGDLSSLACELGIAASIGRPDGSTRWAD